jgi:transcription initiation factor TFIIH subunit 4
VTEASTQIEDGYLIIETNYRVYAYTRESFSFHARKDYSHDTKESPLQIAILSLFLEMKARFGNMVMAVLSRDSVREAFKNGITADQIISFLTSHAHAEMRKQVCDALSLRERKNMIFDTMFNRPL